MSDNIIDSNSDASQNPREIKKSISDKIKKRVEKKRLESFQESPVEFAGDRLSDSKFNTGTPESVMGDPKQLENYRAEQQGLADKAANGIAKFGIKTPLIAAGSIANSVYGPYKAISEGKFSKIYDNDVMRFFEETQRNVDEQFKHYYSMEQKDNGLANRVFNSNFLFNDVLGNAAAFTAGAVLSEMTLGGAFGAMGKAANLTRSGISSKAAKLLKRNSMARKADDLQSAVRKADDAGEYSSKLTVPKDVNEAITGAKQYNKIKGATQGALELGTLGRKAHTGAGYEAGVEALSNMKAITNKELEKWKAEYAQENGEMPSQEEIDEQRVKIKSDIAPITNTQFGVNFGVVGSSHLVTMPTVFGSGIKRLTKKAKGVKIDPETGKAFKKISAGRKLWKGAEKPLSEGLLEEGSQGVAAGAASEYAARKLNPEHYNNKRDFAKSISKGFGETFGTSQGMSEVIAGALIGGIGSPSLGKIFNKETRKDEDKPVMHGGIGGAMFEMKQEGKNADKVVEYINNNPTVADAFRSAVSSEKAKEAFKHNVLHDDANDELGRTLNEGDVFNSKNLNEDQEFSYISSRINSGFGDDMVDEMNSYIDNMDNTQFKQAFEYGDELSDETINARKEEVKNAFANKVNKVQDIKTGIKENTEGRFSAFSKQQQDDLQDALEYSLYKADRADKRMRDLQSELDEIGFTHPLVENPNATDKEVSDGAKQLDQKINQLKDSQQLNEKDLKSAYKDINKLNIVKKQTTRQYNEIANNNAQAKNYLNELENIQDIAARRIIGTSNISKDPNVAISEEDLEQLYNKKEQDFKEEMDNISQRPTDNQKTSIAANIKRKKDNNEELLEEEQNFYNENKELVDDIENVFGAQKLINLGYKAKDVTKMSDSEKQRVIKNDISAQDYKKAQDFRITDSDYKKFQDNNEVSDDIINNIANKVEVGNKLDEREEEIRQARQEEINNKIQEIQAEKSNAKVQSGIKDSPEDLGDEIGTDILNKTKSTKVIDDKNVADIHVNNAFKEHIQSKVKGENNNARQDLVGELFDQGRENIDSENYKQRLNMTDSEFSALLDKYDDIISKYKEKRNEYSNKVSKQIEQNRKDEKEIRNKLNKNFENYNPEKETPQQFIDKQNKVIDKAVKDNKIDSKNTAPAFKSQLEDKVRPQLNKVYNAFNENKEYNHAPLIPTAGEANKIKMPNLSEISFDVLSTPKLDDNKVPVDNDLNIRKMDQNEINNLDVYVGNVGNTEGNTAIDVEKNSVDTINNKFEISTFLVKEKDGKKYVVGFFPGPNRFKYKSNDKILDANKPEDVKHLNKAWGDNPKHFKHQIEKFAKYQKQWKEFEDYIKENVLKQAGDKFVKLSKDNLDRFGMTFNKAFYPVYLDTSEKQSPVESFDHYSFTIEGINNDNPILPIYNAKKRDLKILTKDANGEVQVNTHYDIANVPDNMQDFLNQYLNFNKADRAFPNKTFFTFTKQGSNDVEVITASIGNNQPSINREEGFNILKRAHDEFIKQQNGDKQYTKVREILNEFSNNRLFFTTVPQEATINFERNYNPGSPHYFTIEIDHSIHGKYNVNVGFQYLEKEGYSIEALNKVMKNSLDARAKKQEVPDWVREIYISDIKQRGNINDINDLKNNFLIDKDGKPQVFVDFKHTDNGKHETGQDRTDNEKGIVVNDRVKVLTPADGEGYISSDKGNKWTVKMDEGNPKTVKKENVEKIDTKPEESQPEQQEQTEQPTQQTTEKTSEVEKTEQSIQEEGFETFKEGETDKPQTTSKRGKKRRNRIQRTDSNESDSPLKRGESKPSERIDFEEAANNIREMLPEDVPIETIRTGISNSYDNHVTMGEFLDGSIKLYDTANQGTEYHEAFHAAFRLLLTDSEYNNALNSAKKIFKTPTGNEIREFKRDRYPNQNINGRDLVNMWYEENLADEFEKYAKNRSTKLGKIWQDIVQAFRKIFKFISNTAKARYELHEMYGGLYSGSFSNRKPFKYINRNALRAYKMYTGNFLDEETNRNFRFTVSKDISENVITKTALYAATKDNAGVGEFTKYKREDLEEGFRIALSTYHEDRYEDVIENTNFSEEKKNELFDEIIMTYDTLEANKEDIITQAKNKLNELHITDEQAMDEAELDEANINQKDNSIQGHMKENREKGGFDILPTKLKTYLPFIFTEKDEFQLGITDKTLMSTAPIDAYNLDNFLKNLLSTTQTAEEALYRIQFAAEHNDEVRAFKDDFFSRIGHTENTKPSESVRNHPLFRTFMANYIKRRLDGTSASYDPKTGNARLGKANQQDVEVTQFNKWKNAHNRFKINYVNTYGEDAKNKILDNLNAISDKYLNPNKDISIVERVKGIQGLFDEIGITLSSGFIELSVLKKLNETDNLTIDKDTSDTYSAARKLETYRDTPVIDFATLNGLKTAASKGDMFSTETKKGAANRIKKTIAIGNSIFDSSAKPSVHINDENKQIYDLVDPNFSMDHTFDLISESGKDFLKKLQGFRDNTNEETIESLTKIYKDLTGKDDYLAEKYVKFMKNNPLLDNNVDNVFNEDLIPQAIEGISPVRFDENNNEIPGSRTTGADFSNMDRRTKNIMYSLLSLSKKGDNVSKRGYRLGTYESKSTTYHAYLPYKQSMYKNGSASDTFADDMYKLFLGEYNRITDVEYEATNEAGPAIYTNKGKSPFNRNEGEKEATGLEFFNFNFINDTKYGGSSEFYKKIQAKAKNGENLSDSDINQLKKIFKEYGNKQFDKYLGVLEENGVIRKEKDTYYTDFLPSDYRIQNNKLNVGELANFFLNHGVSVWSYNSLMDGDDAMHYKPNNKEVTEDGKILFGSEGFQDKIKRNAGKIAAGPSGEGISNGAISKSPALVIPSDFIVEDSIKGNEEDKQTLRNAVKKYREASRYDPFVSLDDVGMTDAHNTHRLTEREKKLMNDYFQLDRADAQTIFSLDFYQHDGYLSNFGKLSNQIKQIYAKIRRGETITESDREILIREEADLRPRKMVYYDGDHYIKTSVFTPTREFNSELITHDKKTRDRVNQIYDTIERLLPYRNRDKVNRKISDLYKEVHQYWQPIPGREKHHQLINDMELGNENGSIDFVAFDSGSNMITRDVTESSQDENGNWNWNLIGNKIYQNRFWREQLKTDGDKTEVIDGTQKLQLIWSEQDGEYKVKMFGKEVKLKELVKAYQNLMANRIDKGVSNKLELLTDESGNPMKKYMVENFRNNAEISNSDPKLLEFLSHDEEGNPNYDFFNIPEVFNKIQSMFTSFVSKESLQHKSAGDKLTLLSDDGIPVLRDSKGNIVRTEQFKYGGKVDRTKVTASRLKHGLWDSETESYYSEVMIPKKAAEHFNIGIDEEIPPSVAEAMGIRIPTQDKHSMMSMRVVDFLPAQYGNAIVMPAETVYLAGEDFDIDAKYIRQFATYNKGKTVKKFGDYLKASSKASAISEAFEEIVETIPNENKRIKKQVDEIVQPLRDELEKTESEDRRKVLKRKIRSEKNRVLKDNGYSKEKYQKQIINNYNAAQEGRIQDINPLSIVEADNLMLEMERRFVSNRGNKDISLTPSSMVDIKLPYDNWIKDFEREAKRPYRDESGELEGTNFLSDIDIADNNNSVGDSNIGPGANANTVYQWLANAQVELSEDNWIFGLGKIGSNSKDQKFLNELGKRINDLFSTTISSATDNAKELDMIKYNLTVQAVGDAMQMVMVGVPYEMVLATFRLPITKEYYRKLTNSRSKFKTENERGLTDSDISNNILDRYESEEYQDERFKEFTDSNYNSIFSDMKNIMYQADMHKNNHKPEVQAEIFKQLLNARELGDKNNHLNRITNLFKGLPSTFYDVRNTKMSINEFKKDTVYSGKSVLETSQPINSLINGIQQLSEKSGKFFLTESPLGQKVVDMAEKMTDEDSLSFKDNYNELVQGLLSYLQIRSLRERQNNLQNVSIEQFSYDNVNNILTKLVEEYRNNREDGRNNDFINNLIWEKDTDKNMFENNEFADIKFAVDARDNFTLAQRSMDGFYELMTDRENIEGLDMTGRDVARMLIEYSMVKDGFQFSKNSITKLFPPVVYKNLSEGTRELMNIINANPNDAYNRSKSINQYMNVTENQLIREFLYSHFSNPNNINNLNKYKSVNNIKQSKIKSSDENKIVLGENLNEKERSSKGLSDILNAELILLDRKLYRVTNATTEQRGKKQAVTEVTLKPMNNAGSYKFKPYGLKPNELNIDTSPIYVNGVAKTSTGKPTGSVSGVQPEATTEATTEQTETSTFKGKMSYSYGNNKRDDVTANTTFEAIKNGERTATTRYNNLDYWKQVKKGDIIEWSNGKGETVRTVVTRPLHKLKGSGKTAKQWSKLEGWSVDYFNKNVKPKLDNAWQIEFELEGQTETSQQISKPIEISSNSKRIGAALTNYTTKSKEKGNIPDQYPIEYNGKEYNDVEQAFQQLKDKSEAKTKPSKENSKNYQLMVDLITKKLKTYTELTTAIENRGGSQWILNSTHQPTNQNTVWETGGQNWFIEALNDAYNNAKSDVFIESVRETNTQEARRILDKISNRRDHEVC